MSPYFEINITGNVIVYYFVCNSKYDLYSKSDDIPDVDSLRPYYQGLIDKFCPGQLKW